MKQIEHKRDGCIELLALCNKRAASLEAIHETAKELYDCGIIPKFTMDFYNGLEKEDDGLFNSLLKDANSALDYSEMAHGYIVHEVSKDDEDNMVIRQIKEGEFSKKYRNSKRGRGRAPSIPHLKG